MPWYCNRFVRIGLLVGLGLTIAGAPLMAIAQEYRPPRRGLPGRREGAGTRSPHDRCMQEKQTLMALTPLDNFATTTSATPTFFWFVPGTDATTGQFRLVDQHDNELYSTSVPLPGVPGIVGVQVPATVTTQFQPNHPYQWQFSVICAPEEPSRNPFVEGRIEWVQPDVTLKDSLSTASTSPGIAAIYAAAGVWQDAIATLATQRCLKPQDATLQASWRTLLQSVQLEAFANAPLTGTCRAIGQRSNE